ncbi:hypothetical protein MAR_018836 [Mya arenaria]|uniref:Uncharacterized protein n=1 Tax=Mya arenaria TaxID=6604 RepID=A0ABY7EFT3_MYAAR|nr:hypothetical protein MAR_018836 [Mya arenaria]
MVKETSLTVEKRLLATLWLLSNQESYGDVVDRLGLSKETLHLTVMAIINRNAVMIRSKYS